MPHLADPPLPPDPANLLRSGRGGFSPLPAAPGWRLGEAVALTPGTEGLATVSCALLRPLPLGQPASPVFATFSEVSSTKKGCQLPCLHIPCLGHRIPGLHFQLGRPATS